MVLEITLIAIGAIVVAGLIFLIYSGLFCRVSLAEQDCGPYRLMYTDYKGHPKDSGPLMDEVYHYLKEKGVDTTRGAGIYIDSPKELGISNIRMKLGCLIEKCDYDKASGLTGGYKLLDLPATKLTVAEFPYRNKMSIMFGVWKAYPKLQDKINGPAMELYDVPAKKIQYLPLPKDMIPAD